MMNRTSFFLVLVLGCLLGLHGLLHDHVQFTLLHGPNVPGSYAILFFTALGFTFTTRHTHSWASFLLRPSCFILSGAVSNCPLHIGHLATWGGRAHLLASSLPYHTVPGFLRQEYWRDLPFLPPVDHVLSAFSTMTHPSWVALHGMAHSFIELCKPLQHDNAVIHDGWCVCMTSSVFVSLWMVI